MGDLRNSSIVSLTSRSKVLAFQWSASDVVRGLKIITKVLQAFDNARGATSQLTAGKQSLFELNATLRFLQHITDFPSGEYTADIIGLLGVIRGPFERYEALAKR
jgi:hypothetical protein